MAKDDKNHDEEPAKEAVVEDTEQESLSTRSWAAISYLWFLCFIPLFLKRDDQFVLFHARQGLMLFVAWLFFLVLHIFPVIGHIVGFVGNVAVLVLSFLGVYHAMTGEYWSMPLLGKSAAELNLSTK